MNLADALAALKPALGGHGVLIGWRAIAAGDEHFFPDPARESTPANLARRRASGAARLAARDLMARLGIEGGAAIGRLPGGAPAWPPGLIGSLAHDDGVAVAVVARSGGALKALGVDVAPAAPLPADLFKFVLTPDEQIFCADDAHRASLCFAVKEAVYKAIHPLDGSPLEHRDIDCAPDGRSARIWDGRRLSVFSVTAPNIVAVAALAASDG